MPATQPTQFQEPHSEPAQPHETPPEPVFDRVTKLVSAMLDVPVSPFSIANRDRLYFKSNHGMSGPDAGTGSSQLSDTACQFVVGGGAPLPVVDAGTHPLLRDKRLILELGIQGYLGYPVRSPSGTWSANWENTRGFSPA